LDDQMLIDSLTPPSFPMEPLFSPPPLSFSTISGNTPSAYCQSLQLHMNSPPSAWSPESYSIPEELSWRTGHYPDKVEALIGRLIDYHQRAITHAHYFRWFDYPKFYTEIVFAMADAVTEQVNPLRLAVAAFSALNRSIKHDRSSRELAFVLYAGALQQLHRFLDKPGMDITECQIAVATALELASFDVCSIVCGFLNLAILRRRRKEFSTYNWGCKDTATSYGSSAILL